MQNDLKRALLALGGGPNEFCINNAITSQSSFGWTAFEVVGLTAFSHALNALRDRAHFAAICPIRA